MKKIIFLFLFILPAIQTLYSQSEFDGDNLFKFIHEDYNSPKGKKLQDWYGLKLLAASTYHSPGKSFNLSLVDYNGVHRISSIEIKDFMPEYEIFGKFEAPLPLGLKWGMTIDEIKVKLNNKHNQHGDNSLYYHYDRNSDFILRFNNKNEKNEFRLESMVMTKANHFEMYEKAKPDLKQFMPNPETYKYIIPLKKTEQANNTTISNPAVVNSTPVTNTSDFCTLIKNLLTDVTNGFAQQKKIKHLTPKSWQLENKIPGAVFTELKQNNYPVNGKTVYTYYARIKDNITQGPEANKALEDLKNNINACLPGYKMKESSLSMFTDNADEVLGYSWETAYNKPSVELSREITSSGKANIFLIIKPD